MATVTKRKAQILIEFDKADPSNITWTARAQCVVTDTTVDGGEREFWVSTLPQSATRTAWRTGTGQNFETGAKNAVDAVIAALGSGSHTVNEDIGS